MDIEAVLELLRRACDAAGGQRAWARMHRVAPGQLNDVLQGRRPPGPRVLRALGIAKAVDYRRVRGATEESGTDESEE